MKDRVFFDANKLIVFVMAVSILLLSGFSFAWYKLSISSEKAITLTSGELKITFDDSKSSTIVLENAEPMSDADGLLTTAYTFSIQNSGSVDTSYNLYLDDVLLENGTRMADQFVKYSLTKEGDLALPTLLSSNKSFTKDDGVVSRSIGRGVVTASTTDKYTLHLWISDTASNEVMETILKVRLRIEAEQYVKPLCQRASQLHTDGDVTYGSLGSNKALASGDAFDCDVNGDDVYDSKTERFYYLGGLVDNPNTAVMVYYRNIGNSSYDDLASSYVNGPITAIKSLPTIDSWNNIRLISPVRKIFNETGSIEKLNFSYDGYAARMLSYSEIYNVCDTNISNRCSYLLENMGEGVGYWLEDLNSTSHDNAWYIGQNGVLSTAPISSSNIGVRPIIEVSQEDISY